MKQVLQVIELCQSLLRVDVIRRTDAVLSLPQEQFGVGFCGSSLAELRHGSAPNYVLSALCKIPMTLRCRVTPCGILPGPRHKSKDFIEAFRCNSSWCVHLSPEGVSLGLLLRADFLPTQHSGTPRRAIYPGEGLLRPRVPRGARREE